LKFRRLGSPASSCHSEALLLLLPVADLARTGDTFRDPSLPTGDLCKAGALALKWGYNPLIVAAVNGFFLVIELIFVAANMTKLIEGGWFPLLMAGAIAFLMLTWRTGWQLLEHERSKLRQREDEFIAWVLNNPPIRLPGAAAIFTAASTGIPLGLTHHLRHNRVLHERVLLIAAIIVDAPRVEPEQRIRLVPVGAGIIRVLFHFGFMEIPDMMEGLKIACLVEPAPSLSIQVCEITDISQRGQAGVVAPGLRLGESKRASAPLTGSWPMPWSNPAAVVP
jgi:K+ transporter